MKYNQICIESTHICNGMAKIRERRFRHVPGSESLADGQVDGVPELSGAEWMPTHQSHAAKQLPGRENAMDDGHAKHQAFGQCRLLGEAGQSGLRDESQ